MKFEWDENKNKSNQEKHKIDFNDAKQVFADEKRTQSEDTRKDYGEKRWITVGKMYKALTVVVFTMRETAIRIISARFVNKREREAYNENQNKTL